MGVTDFREGVYAFGIECDAASCKSTRIPFGALRYFCRDCYDEHPELGGFDYCISCMQPAMQMRTHPTPPASVIKALLQSLPPVVVCRIRRFTRGRAEVTLCRSYRPVILRYQLGTSLKTVLSFGWIVELKAPNFLLLLIL